MPVKKARISKTESVETVSVSAPETKTTTVELSNTEQVAGGKKKAAAKPAAKKEVMKVDEVKETKEVKVAPKKKAVAKKADGVVKAKKAVKKVAKEESKDDQEAEEEDTKTRSFKVQLPGDEDFTGRFTGLTPYQAANKALSKYFRSNENKDVSDANQINFSIKESTRGSKRQVYAYKGNRLKLEVPISYTIKSLTGEERVIVKQYKNQLIKIKKNVKVESAPAVLA
jgi:hypothetical protein